VICFPVIRPISLVRFVVSGNRPNNGETDYAVPDAIYVIRGCHLCCSTLHDDVFKYRLSSLLSVCVMAYKSSPRVSIFSVLSVWCHVTRFRPITLRVSALRWNNYIYSREMNGMKKLRIEMTRCEGNSDKI